MKKIRFAEARLSLFSSNKKQAIRLKKSVENTASPQQHFAFGKQYGGMEDSDARRMKDLGEERG